MANNELAIKFTDESYLTRAEVARTLGTNLIDTLWSQILNYRRQSEKALTVSDIYKMPYSVTLTDSIKNKVAQANNRCQEVIDTFSEMPNGSYEMANLKKEMFKLELRHYAKAKNIQVNDVALDNILFNKNSNPIYQPIVNYYRAISKFENDPFATINEDLLAEYLTILNDGKEITSFYRTAEISQPGQKALINREFNGVPVAYIEDMMANLFNYIKGSGEDRIVKVATVHYIFNYIKPFDSYNDEIALILSRYILATYGLGEAPAFIPFEKVFTDKADLFKVANRETQKLHDVTYHVMAFMSLQEDAVRDFLDCAFRLRRNSAEQAYYGSQTQNEFKPQPKVEQSTPVVEQPKQTSTNSFYSTHFRAEPVQKPVEQPKSVVEQPKVEVRVEQPKPSVDTSITTSKPAVSVHEFEDLDEKALRKAETNLLHRDPNLKKAQAHFYVRHCTLGECYTIQEFKKMERCVYETARTSMDGLARLGYYRREQIKNKFVYTPISKD